MSTAPSASDSGATPGAPAAHDGHIVGRGMLALVLSQLITTPVSMTVQALIGRKLGAGPFGAIYFATSVLGVWYLFVEWGGHAQVAAAVARDRQAGARVFASGMLLRLLFAAVVLAVIPAFGRWMEYDEAVQLALAMVSMKLALQGLGALCLAVIRGYEKVHWQAGANIFGNLTEAALVVGVLMAGGDLGAVLMAQVVAAVITLAAQVGLVTRLNLGSWRPDPATAWSILQGGFSFLVLDMVLRLQPYIDASYLEHLAPPEAMGWHSAASRISGVLIFPALTLNSALYPTLARLWVSDRATYDKLVRLGLRTVTILGVLAGVGTALFAPWAVGWIYGSAQFAPAGISLSVMSVFIVLVYGSIVLGPAIAAAGRQWSWCAAQTLCLVVSLALDPILIPWAQRTYGNGSLGVSISIGVAEIAMVLFGLVLLPRGALDRSTTRTALHAGLEAAVAVAAGVLLYRLPLVAIVAMTVAYFGVLRWRRELDADLLMLAPPWLARFVQPWLGLTH